MTVLTPPLSSQLICLEIFLNYLHVAEISTPYLLTLLLRWWWSPSIQQAHLLSIINKSLVRHFRCLQTIIPSCNFIGDTSHIIKYCSALQATRENLSFTDSYSDSHPIIAIRGCSPDHFTFFIWQFLGLKCTEDFHLGHSSTAKLYISYMIY